MELIWLKKAERERHLKEMENGWVYGVAMLTVGAFTALIIPYSTDCKHLETYKREISRLA